MKSLFIAIFAISFWLVGCQPKDNKLNSGFQRSGSDRTSAQNQNLKLGSYGQPLYVAQLAEQAGMLIQNCLALDSATVEKVQVKQSFELKKQCRLKSVVNTTVSGNRHSMQEDWTVVLWANGSLPLSYRSLLRVEGSLERSRGRGQMKGKDVLFHIQEKSFFWNRTENDNFDLTMSMQISAKVAGENLDFLIDFAAQGEDFFHGENLEGLAWGFTKVKYDFDQVDSNFDYQVTSEDLRLQFQSQCGDFDGNFKVQDNGKTWDIQLTPEKATLTTTGKGVRSWEMNLQTCEKRQKPLQNFEFLFY